MTYNNFYTQNNFITFVYKSNNDIEVYHYINDGIHIHTKTQK